jgi:uncharacterized protein (DUF983 family)
MTRFRAILRQRCPVCLRGRVFRGLWRTREQCSVCETRYDREHGYFVGAMYLAYGLGVLILVPLTVWLMALDVSVWWIALIAELQIVVCSPLLFRYSRVLWLHLDEILDPREDSRSLSEPGSQDTP